MGFMVTNKIQLERPTLWHGAGVIFLVYNAIFFDIFLLRIVLESMPEGISFYFVLYSKV
jgi:hypothetical protein